MQSRSRTLLRLFGVAGYFAVFFVTRVEPKVAWSSTDVFNPLISTKDDKARWNQLAAAIKELKKWPVYYILAPDGSESPPIRVRPWEELAEIALGVIEDVRVQLEPVDIDTEALDQASDLLQKFELGSILDVIISLDTVDGYLTDVPKWLAGLAGLITFGEAYEKNLMSIVFWMFGATFGSLTPGGEIMVIWETNHPYELLSMFLNIKLGFMEAGMDFEEILSIMEALAVDFGDKELLALQEIVAYCLHYEAAAKWTSSVIESIMKTGKFQLIYEQSNTLYPIPQELEGFYKKYESLPPGQRAVTLLEEINTMSEIEEMRRDGWDSSSIWLDI
ncbi:hypothetical protein TWF506_005233 [Arthrobotrys conoides]|uniref:Uncharacterized protein n=1 Tax=Arthrobotrys conoides TaxID=74498 RepID=A0AAN8NTQ5_9PEZI